MVIVFVSVLSSLLEMCCSRWRWRPFFWLILSDLAPRRCCCCCCWRLVVVTVLSFLEAASFLVAVSVSFYSLSSSSSSLGLLSLAASCCYRCRRLLVIVGSGGVLSLLSASELRRSLKILVHIRLTMHATTMEPEHQA